MAQITLTSAPLTAATAALERTAKLYDSIARSNERLARAADREQIRSQRAQTRLLSGPFGRLEQLRSLRGANLTDTQRLDLERRIGMTERQLGRGQRLGFTGRLATAVRSTRFGAGPVSPLVGRTLDVIAPGLGGAMAPITLAATGVALAFGALKEVVQTSTTALTGFRQAAMESGGTTAQVAGLRAMGLSPAEISARGAALHGAATSGDPFATMRAMAAGVSIMPGELGNQNQAQQYQNAVRYLRQLGQVRGAEEQLRAARSLGMVDALSLANASNKVWQAWEKDAASAAKVFDPAHQRAAADLDQQVQRLASNWETLKVALGKPLIGPLADTAGEAADNIRKWEAVMTGHGFLAGPGGKPANILDYLFRGVHPEENTPASQAQDEHKSATEENTSAIRDLVGATHALRRDITGGGVRTGGVLPGGLSGAELVPAMTAGRFRLGAFRHHKDFRPSNSCLL